MKNSTKRFVALLLLLVALVGYLGGAGEIVMAEESAWTKEDFLYSNDTTIIAFSEQGMEKSKTMKTLSFPEGVVTINGNYSLSHKDDPRRFEREFGRGKEWDKIIIPDSVENLGYAVFLEARTKEVQLSKNLKSLGGLAFFNNGLQEVTLPHGLEVINHNAFERNKLETITIPETVNFIDQYAFTRNNLHTIKILGEPRLSEKGVFANQVATYKPAQNPFYEEHFGYNGNFQVDNLPEELSYENGEFSFKSDDVDMVTFDFSLANTSYEGSMTIVNSHKYSQGVQVKPETTEADTQTDNKETTDVGTQTDDKETTEAGTQTDNPDTSEQATQTQVEVLVKYVSEDGTVYKEDKVSADIGAILDSGDLPMLSNDMKFIDDFLFYEVKESDNVIERKVAKLVEDKEPETDDKEQQVEDGKKEDTSTQTDLTRENLAELEDKSNQLAKEVEKLKETLIKSEEVSKEQKEKIELLEKEKADLKQELDEAKKQSEEASKKEETDENKACLEQVKALEEKLAGIDRTLQETNKIIKENQLSSSQINTTQAKETPEALTKQQNNTAENTIPVKSTGSTTQSVIKENLITGVKEIEKPKSALLENSGENTQVKNPNGETQETPVNQMQEKDTEIRYPNKLTPKQPANGTSNDMNGNNQSVNANKGVASDPSKARATVTENVDNANNDFPIHNGTVEEGTEANEGLPYYSADARQFVTFMTKNGKTFHLIIDHDETQENVMLLTEVSEDDLLNMVETKEEPKKEEPVKIEEPEPVVEEPVKEEESSNAGTYLLVGLVIAGVLGAGYYFKVVKAKENEELASFEEDDDYYSESEDSYIDSSDDDEEEDIDSEDLL